MEKVQRLLLLSQDGDNADHTLLYSYEFVFFCNQFHFLY